MCGVMTTKAFPPEAIDREQVRRWTANDLADLLDMPRATLFRDLIPAMRAAGVLVPRGRFWFARQRELEDFLLGRLVSELIRRSAP